MRCARHAKGEKFLSLHQFQKRVISPLFFFADTFWLNEPLAYRNRATKHGSSASLVTRFHAFPRYRDSPLVTVPYPALPFD